MSLVRIDASPKQLSKLRNGHRVRVKPAMAGQGFNLIIHPERYDAISRTFSRGKGMELALTPEEIMANQATASHPDTQGEGIFGKKFDRFLEKHHIKDLAYKIGDVIKPYAKGGITAGLTAGATALGAVQPELIPFLAPAVAGASSLASDYLDRPSYYQNAFSSNAGGPKSAGASTLAGQVAQNHLLNALNQELGTKYGALGQANLGNAIAHKERAGMTNAQHNAEESALLFGTGLYAGRARGGMIGRSREMGSVGKGAGFVGMQTALSPALQSQPFSSNFQFQHFLPPSYQKFSKGSGLY